MLATPGALPDGPEWVYEVKWDGIRLLADVSGGAVRLRTHAGHEVTAQFPELAGLVGLGQDVLLDGEVVLVEHGVPSFAALAERLHAPVDERATAAHPVTYMVFDVLRLYGVSLVDRPLEQRRSTLERLALGTVANLSLSPGYGDGAALLAVTGQRGMEGVVAKRLASPYRPGRRSPDWVEVTHRQSALCLVGGWQPERSSAGRIGALLLGVPEGEGLRYVGRVEAGLAGAGAQRELGERLMRRERSPFGRLPGREGAGARWCEPLTVVEVRHLGWSEAGRLRGPVFRELRDLDPAQVPGAG